MGKSKKAIKQHYNQILKDRGHRAQHFTASGALGSEREGRELGRQIVINAHNTEARHALHTDNDNVIDDRLEQLKSGKKITL